MTSTLDIERADELLAYLTATRRLEVGESVRVRVLAGGISNRSVLVERLTGGWVLKQALSRLRVDAEWFSDPSRVHREAAALRLLEELVPGRVPAFVFEDWRYHVLCMDAVPEPHENWKVKLLAGRVEAGEIESFARLLGTIHLLTSRRVAEFCDPFADRTFFESLRLEPYYEFAATRVPSASRFLRGLAAETRTLQVTLVHGDYSPKNVLIHDSRLVLLDHEVVHLGDPAFDLGFSLAHFLSKAHHLPAVREEILAGAVHYWEVYRETIGDVPWSETVEERTVRHALACLLARVAGRSPLEYLNELERDRQQAIVLGLLRAPPAHVAELSERFGTGMG